MLGFFGKGNERKGLDPDILPEVKLPQYPQKRAFLDVGTQIVLNEQAATLTNVEHRVVNPGQEIHLWSDTRSIAVEQGEQGIELTFRNNEERIKYYDTLRKLENEANQESSL